MSAKLIILAAAATLAMPATQAAQAREYPWCAYYGGSDNDATNCGFETREQCRAGISGVGGYCQTNPRYIPSGRDGRHSNRTRK
jgi:hypothetical protein